MLKGLLTGLCCNRYYDRKDWEPHKSRSPSVRSWELEKKEHCEGTHEGLTISKIWRPRARDGMVIIIITTSCSCVCQSKLCDSKRRICYWSAFFFFLWMCRRLCRWVEMRTRTTESTPSPAQRLCLLAHIHLSLHPAPTAKGAGSHPPIRGTTEQL